MSFISLYYLLFIAIVCLLYFLIPKKWRWVVLLIASYFFYMINDIRSVGFLIVTTLTIYFATTGMQKIDIKQQEFFNSQDEEWLKENKKDYVKKTRRKKKWILIATLLFNFGILFALKYFAYLADAFANLINAEPLQLKLLFPLGISFYMFQSVGYLIDVYYGKSKPEKNPFKVALFVSFFPQIIQGPISKFNELEPQLIEGHDFDHNNLKSGVLMILWGYFKKLVIADRGNLLFKAIMDNYTNFQGAEIFFAMCLYYLVLYCDFSGGIDIAIGTAKCLGIDVTPNFKRPFFSTSISDYWKRWHITLGTWMTDYVLYPLTLSKGYNKFIRKSKKTFKGVAGKVIPSGIAMFLVFFLVGVWHGPNLIHLCFGLYNGVIVLVETIFKEARKFKKAEAKPKSKHMQRFIWYLKWSFTFMLIYFGKYFSAAPDVPTAWNWLVATFQYTYFPAIFHNFLARAGFTTTNFVILIVATIFLITIEIFQERGFKIREFILKRKEIIQWVIFYAAIALIILLTIYSSTGGGFAYESF